MTNSLNVPLPAPFGERRTEAQKFGQAAFNGLAHLREVALMLNMKERTVVRKVARGEIPEPDYRQVGIMFRKDWYWRRDRVQAWLDAGRPTRQTGERGNR